MLLWDTYKQKAIRLETENVQLGGLVTVVGYPRVSIFLYLWVCMYVQYMSAHLPTNVYPSMA